MKIADCLPVMTTIYMARIVDSIIKEGIPRGDEERLREQIRQNIKELAGDDRIAEALHLGDMTRPVRILMEGILVSMLDQPEAACTEETLFEAVRAYEQGIVDEATQDGAFKFSDTDKLGVYETVLEVALNDDRITPDEFALLNRLRTRLGISRHETRLLEAKLGQFPKVGNELHSLEEFKDALKFLQKGGVVFYCNRAEGGPLVVIPEEIVPAVKRQLGYEMRPEAQAVLHGNLATDQLRLVLLKQGLPLAGSKGERSERLLKAGVRPSEVLAVLKNDDLGTLCRRLPGVNVAGSKQERIDRIIHYFSSLTVKESQKSDDPRADFYLYFEEFAARDNQNLYQLGKIKHDRDMERGFEEGTRYLFEVKLGQTLIEMQGSDHADGGVAFSNGELLLWDNKGKESEYAFPKKHLDQFKRYIRESVKRVNVFLVVVPEATPGARLQAIKLKHESGKDTDVAIITAADLKFVAEKWRKYSKGGVFCLEVFNSTGILSRQDLEARMGVFLK